MRAVLAIAIGTLVVGTASAAEPSPYVGACDDELKAEVQRLETGFEDLKTNWRKEVKTRFDAMKLTVSQRQRAEVSLAQLVMKMAETHAMAVTLPGLYRSILLVPVYDPSACGQPEKRRELTNMAVAGYRKMLDELLPLTDTVAEVAKRDP